MTEKGTINKTFSMREADAELIAWAARHLGTSQSDVVRSAIRAYVFHLQTITRERN